MSRRGLRANCVLEQEARWRVQSGLRGADGGGGRVGLRMGGGAVAARAYIARTNPNGNSSLGGASPIMHTPVLTGRPCSRSLLVFTLSLSLLLFLSLFHLSHRRLSLFLGFTPSPVTVVLRPPRRPLPQPNDSIASYPILGSTQLQRNRPAILGDKVTS